MENFSYVLPSVEVAETVDNDLMRLKVFGCHEGINGNGTEFPREVLEESYHSFIDKTVVVVIDEDNLPSGHAYNFTTHKFNEKARKHIGHIVDAYPCIVTEDNKIIKLKDGDLSEIEKGNIPDGEYRIICELVLNKQYEPEICQLLLELHAKGQLNFSMECLADYFIDDNGIKHCTKIHFTGLCIVKRPAFINSYSIEVSEKKEEQNLDFEKMYQEATSKFEKLVAEKANLQTEYDKVVNDKETVENELREQVCQLKTTIAELETQNDTLKVYKEKFENAEKLELGKTRKEKLLKYGKVVESNEELAELTQEDYLSKLEKAVDAYVPSSQLTNGVGSVAIETASICETKDNKEQRLNILSVLAQK